MEMDDPSLLFQVVGQPVPLSEALASEGAGISPVAYMMDQEDLLE